LTNDNKYCLIHLPVAAAKGNTDLSSKMTIAHDKGKPVAKQGRKAVESLF
jgi:hypothetical protein